MPCSQAWSNAIAAGTHLSCPGGAGSKTGIYWAIGPPEEGEWEVSFSPLRRGSWGGVAT